VRAGIHQGRLARSLRPALVACLAVLLVGCGLRIPTSLRTPTVAGVVEDVTRLADGGVTYRLQNGKSAEIASQKQVLLGGEPLVGELLLAGTDSDGRQWLAGVSPSPNVNEPGCFWLTANGRDAGDWIETSDGLRMQEALDFDPGLAEGGEYTSPRGCFCLNGEGEVTSYVFV